ncbi:hypothetical protein FPOA_13401 [Fusarium poae]|uniref:Uncharacterized protein n=1 Tax=Fusarium poae TaxID=36050 RepID=A0A1B8A5T1_FUSPO|nr:hypothetical protein FPOA_13827 [Fusarium poae]OBS15840.1 hypothetical protein FPOA_13401 [Fusarium poae]
MSFHANAAKSTPSAMPHDDGLTDQRKIEFLVGEHETLYTFPLELFTEESTKLAAKAEKEASDLKDTLRHCTEKTFGRLFQALTILDYREEVPADILTKETTDAQEKPVLVKEEDNRRDGSTVNKDHLKLVVPDKLPYSMASYKERWKSFETTGSEPWSLDAYKHGLRVTAINSFLRPLRSSGYPGGMVWEPDACEDVGKSYFPVFMSHFELFKIANELGPGLISEMALYRLRVRLSTYVVHEAAFPDLIRFTVEVYKTTAPGNPARAIISNFVACFHQHMFHYKGFITALREVDDLLLDVHGYFDEKYSPSTALRAKRQRTK